MFSLQAAPLLQRLAWPAKATVTSGTSVHPDVGGVRTLDDRSFGAMACEIPSGSDHWEPVATR